MPHNGEVNQILGIYKTVCCGAEIVIIPGAVFPDCPRHPKLTTIWKFVVEEKKASPAGACIEVHIANRRLFDFAAGMVIFEAWEHRHLHDCSVCQAMLHV